MYSIKATLEYEGFHYSKELWDFLRETHFNFDGLKIEDGYSGKKVLFEDFGNYLNLHDMEDFRVEFSDGSIDYGDVNDSNLATLYIKNLVLNEADADQWLIHLIQDDRFVHAAFYDFEYDIWQNMDDLMYYETSNRSYDHLPLKSNGLPFPLEATVVDTTNNPGRYVFRNGYIEFVGSVMWLGEQFWEKTGTCKDMVLACDWLEIKEIGSVIRIKALDKVFTTAEGREGELQNNLRNLLYFYNR